MERDGRVFEEGLAGEHALAEPTHGGGIPTQRTAPRPGVTLESERVADLMRRTRR
jgi:hypothetical protein